MSWLHEVAEAWTGGWQVGCQAGHDWHEHTEYPTSQGHMLGYDWQLYEGTSGYCPGDDEVSKSFQINGSWEQYSTSLVKQILMSGPGAVIDIGSHVGWYSMLAAMTGHDVLAVEAVLETLQLLRLNAGMRRTERVVPCRAWLNEDTAIMPVTDHVRLLKSDIEGLEDQTLRVCRPLLERGQVDFILMEVSPIFKDHYPTTVQTILDFGFRADIVGPQLEHLDTDIARRIADFDQRDVLFVKMTS